MRDAYQRQCTKQWDGVATTVAQAHTDADALAVDLEAVSGAGVAKHIVSQETLLSPTVASGSNLDAGGTLHCRLDNGKLYPIKIPAINPAVVLSDGNIDITDALILAFVAHFQSGGEFTVSEGDLVVTIEGGELDT